MANLIENEGREAYINSQLHGVCVRNPYPNGTFQALVWNNGYFKEKLDTKDAVLALVSNRY